MILLDEAISFFIKCYYLFLSVSIFYPILVVYFLYNKNNKNDKYDKLYFLWNLNLSLFSIWGSYQTVPVLVKHIIKNGIVYTINNPNINSELAYPMMLFSLSKIFELGDTIFVHLRGRNLIFLQYYHHYITLLFCWYAFIYTTKINGTNSFFSCMNYMVHSMMYSWYTLTSVKIKTPNYIKNIITFVQFIQMIIGIIITTIATITTKWYLDDLFVVCFLYIMYGSYVYMFGKLFFSKIKQS